MSVIPLARPDILDQDITAVEKVLRSGFLVQGDEVAAFEQELAAMVGTQHAIAVSSGTAALHVALRALGVGPGDRVAVPAYSWIATANVVALVGATPVFVDVESRDFCIDVDKLAETLDADPNIRAVIPVHAFGRMAKMPEIGEIAERHEIPVIEDAACALGAIQEGAPAGSIGALGCFSFHPMKVTTTGEGGCVTTDNTELANAIRRDRNHGQEYDGGVRRFVSAGFNYRLTDVMAALGRSQLTRLEASLDERRQRAERYNAMLSEVDGVTAPQPPDEATTVQSFVVLLDPGTDADRVAATMRADGVEVGLGTIGMPFTAVYDAPHNIQAFPVTLDIVERSVSLPMFAGLSDSDQERVIGSLTYAIERARA